ncbi:hypothetical protein QBC35DRAFT_40165 [Podospora australis]|uniref:Mid2 domain-containing protein n=1 Tax=Podospora australis TaxID=1536484 RepID=A0AAN7ADQ4_9PEZI|nr:hypothetical protein QBC35DRAFT_40165 [Podospora australis]
MSTLKGPPWPSFPTEWTAPTSCFATTNYYRVLLGSGFFSNMYGTPTPVLTGIYPTGDCWPPSSTVNVPYQTDGGCPAGFTRACASGGSVTVNGKPVSTVTCCPSVTGNVFSFMCRDNEYGCHATATEGAVWTGVITDISLETPTEEPVTRTPNSLEGIEAWGIKMISVAPATDSSTRSGSSTASTASKTAGIGNAGQGGQDNNNETTPAPSANSGGLSTGATVGIAVAAVLVGAAILAAAGFLLWRRHQKRKQNLPELDENAGGMAGMDQQYQHHGAPRYGPDGYAVPPNVKPDGTVYHQLDTESPPQMLDSREAAPGHRPVWEMQA